MKRITHNDKYIELTNEVCVLLCRAHIINECDDDAYQPLHDYHPAFAEQTGDVRNEEYIWTALVEIAEAYGEGIKTCTENVDPIREDEA